MTTATMIEVPIPAAVYPSELTLTITEADLRQGIVGDPTACVLARSANRWFGCESAVANDSGLYIPHGANWWRYTPAPNHQDRFLDLIRFNFRIQPRQAPRKVTFQIQALVADHQNPRGVKTNG